MPKIIKSLTDTTIRKTKNDAQKDIKLADGNGLYLVITKLDQRLWRFDYSRPYTKKRNTISFGAYPTVSLARARELRDEARALLATNIDPMEEKKRVAQAHIDADTHQFENVAAEWLKIQQLAPGTIKRHEMLLKVINADIGRMPIQKLKVQDILRVCRYYEQQEKLETAKKVKVLCGQIMRYAVSLGYCERDLTTDLRGILKTPRPQHMPAITKPEDFAKLLQDIEHYDGNFTTICALKILPLVFVRPGELRTAKWNDIDFDNRLWSYTPPKTKLKTGVEHIVPLSTQVLEILKALYNVHGNKSVYVFPSLVSLLKPMSDNTINKALRRLDYGADEVTAHGFRATARTLLDEVLDYPVEIIEMQLAHQVRDMHGRAYNRTKHLDKRREMMQRWADYCDQLKLS